MQINIDKVVSNPYRNFDIYPIDEAQVLELMDSFEDTGDFGVLPVRLNDEGMYELGAGHHRLEAMKRIGYTTVDVKLINHCDDDHMIKIMANENAKQKGHNAPGQLDSLAAIIKRVSYLIFISETADDLREIAPSAFERLDDNHLESARAALMRGSGLGYQIVGMYADKIMKESEYHNLLRALKETGAYSQIIEEQQQIVEAELEAREEAERKAAEEAAAELEKQRKAEAAAKKAAQRANEAAKKAAEKAAAAKKKADKEAAERKRKEAEQAEERQRKLAVLRKKAAKEEKDRIEKARASAKLRQQARDAAAKSKEKAAGLHPDMLNLIREDHILDRFRMCVVGSEWFPVQEHPELWKDIQQLADELNEGNVSRGLVDSYFREETLKRDSKQREILREIEEQERNSSEWKKIDAAVDGFRKSISGVRKSLFNLQEAIKHPQYGAHAFREIAMDAQLEKDMSAVYNMIQRIRTVTRHSRDNVVNT